MAFTENFRQIEFNPDKEIREMFRATQGDTKSQGFNVVVVLGGKKKVITTETMSFFAQKPDGTRVTDMAVKDGDGFKIELKNQVFAVPGIVVCTLVLRGANGEKLAGRQFKIFVAGSMEDGAIISEDEREFLDRAFDLATDIVPRLEDVDLVKLETAEIKETEREQNEEARENNEENRVTAENKRESAETERKNAETSRVSAENDRTTAETARVEAETTRAGFYDTYNQELTKIKADIDYTDEQLALKADLSEIEVARGTEPTLGARLDADKAALESILKIEKWNIIDTGIYLPRTYVNGETTSTPEVYFDTYQYIPVIANTTYYIGCTHKTYNARFVNWYTSTKTLISTVDGMLKRTTSLVSPSNAAFVTITYNIDRGATGHFITNKPEEERGKLIGISASSVVGLDKLILKNNTQVQEIRRPTFSFIFDDGKSTDQAIKNLFDSYGFKCGFAILPTANLPLYKQWQSEGFEVLAHSVNGTAFSTITDLAIVEQYLRDSLIQLTNNGLNVTGWVTPSSSLLPEQLPLVKKYYQYGYGFIKGDPYVYTHTMFGNDIRQLQRWSLQSNTIEQTNAQIDDVIAKNGYMCFYAHQYPSADNFTEVNLKAILDRLKALSDKFEINVLAPRDAINNYYSFRWSDLVEMRTV